MTVGAYHSNSAGSLLVSSAHFGARVWGTDIDPLVLRGAGKTTRAKAPKKLRGGLLYDPN